MLDYDEAALMPRLGRLDCTSKTAFAAACAQRLLALKGYSRQQAADTASWERLAGIVEAAWQGCAGEEIDCVSLESDAVALVPDEDGDGWTTGSAHLGNAATAAAYALRTHVSDDAQDAAWAALQLYEAADFAYFQQRPGAGSFTTVDMGAALGSEIVQSALAAIHGDLEAVENGMLFPDLRRRAIQEAQLWAAMTNTGGRRVAPT